MCVCICVFTDILIRHMFCIYFMNWPWTLRDDNEVNHTFVYIMFVVCIFVLVQCVYTAYSLFCAQSTRYAGKGTLDRLNKAATKWNWDYHFECFWYGDDECCCCFVVVVVADDAIVVVMVVLFVLTFTNIGIRNILTVHTYSLL